MDQTAVVVILAAIVGAAVRLLKSDIKWFPTIPARWRAVAAVVLGQVGGALESVVGGAPLGPSLLHGLIAAMVAISGNEVLLENVVGQNHGRGPAAPDAAVTK